MQIPLAITDKLSSCEERTIRNYLRRVGAEETSRFLGILSTLVNATRSDYGSFKPVVERADEVGHFLWEVVGLCPYCEGSGIGPIPKEEPRTHDWVHLQVPGAGAAPEVGRCGNCASRGRRGGKVRPEGDLAL